MKKLVFILVAALFLGSLFTEASARNTPEKEMKKCCHKIKKEIRQSLRGPSFEYLKPDCHEEVKIYLAIDKNNQVKVVKLIGNDDKLNKYVKETIEKEKIEVNPKLSGKMFIMDAKFIHQPV